MKRLFPLVAACCCAAMPALALDLTSSTASSASSAGSASVGSVSDSLRSSSQSSAGPRQMADGDYRVIEVAEVEGRPDEVRLTLEARAPGQTRTATATAAEAAAGPHTQWMLTLPRRVAEREALAAGRWVRAAQQPYGVAFTLADQPRPFFLVLADDWHRELPARPVRGPAQLSGGA